MEKLHWAYKTAATAAGYEPRIYEVALGSCYGDRTNPNMFGLRAELSFMRGCMRKAITPMLREKTRYDAMLTAIARVNYLIRCLTMDVPYLVPAAAEWLHNLREYDTILKSFVELPVGDMRTVISAYFALED